MLRKITRVTILQSAIAALTIATSLPLAAQASNWWAGPERSGECYIPNMQTSFRCQFGPYRRVQGARQIGGFYINPTNRVGQTGRIPLEYRVNGGNWVPAFITMNATRGNYIDFGNGVHSFEYRFPRPQNGPLRAGGGTIYFRMNYDLDR